MSKVEKVLVEVDTLIMYAGWADDARLIIDIWKRMEKVGGSDD